MDLEKLMAEAKKMQDKMQSAQSELQNVSVKGEAGGGLVTVTMKGNRDVSAVSINPNLLEEGVEMIQDLVMSAYNDANRRVESKSQEKINELTAGLNIPKS